jgi:hypothetical protein
MTPFRRDTIVQGVIAGLIGYAVVAVLFALLNVVSGQPPFATAAQLGAWLLGRGIVAPAVPLDPAPIIAFNGVHLLVMIGAGTLASALVAVWDRYPRAWYLPFFGLIMSVLVVLLSSVALFTGLLHTVRAFDIMWINIVAAALVGWYLMAVHPHLREHWTEFGDE